MAETLLLNYIHCPLAHYRSLFTLTACLSMQSCLLWNVCNPSKRFTPNQIFLLGSHFILLKPQSRYYTGDNIKLHNYVCGYSQGKCLTPAACLRSCFHLENAVSHVPCFQLSLKRRLLLRDLTYVCENKSRGIYLFKWAMRDWQDKKAHSIFIFLSLESPPEQYKLRITKRE